MGAFEDFIQAASNTSAETVAGPVDLISMLLKHVGIPVGTAVGGSEWMKQKGLMRDVPMGGARLAGETMGLLAPIAAAQYAPQIARGLMTVGENAAKPSMMNPQKGAIVYHGSPHKFDKFDSSKIGTGEGAQAYGHGLYLAEAPEVAKAYSTAGYQGFRLNGEVIHPTTTKGAKELAAAALSRYPDKKEAIAWIGKDFPSSGQEAKAIIRAAKDYGENAGSLYKVDLPDTAIAKMLDWDKPLSQQAPEVQQALETLGLKYNAQASGAFDDALMAALEGTGSTTLPKMPRNPMGSEIARGAGIFDGPGDVVKAAKLRAAGIPGIRYLDGGSRGAGSGTSNYVLFPGEEDLLKILERNGGLMSP